MIKTKRPSISRRKMIILVAGSALLLAAAVCLLFLLLRDKPVFTVNGVPITSAHEQLYLDQTRGEVTGYYYRKYGADVNETGFWQRSFHGQTPEEYSRALARSRLIRDTVERLQARDHGAKVSVTLAELEQEMAARNNGSGIAYGPEKYELREFLAQTQSVARDGLKTALQQGELAPTDADLRLLYDQNSSGMLDSGYAATVGVFSCGTLKAGQYPAKLTEALTLAAERRCKGEVPGETIAAVARETGLSLQYDEYTFDKNDIPKEDSLLPVLSEYCRTLGENQHSEVWETGVTRGIAVVLHKEERGRADFASARTVLENLWLNEAYEVYLDRAAEAAVIR